MDIRKIVTHAGTFHADEILSIALLRYVGINAPIHRTYEPTDKDLADKDIYVLDVGRHYDPALLNFDHHQDASLPATNLLLLRSLDLDGMYNAPITTRLEETFFKRVSDIDVGRIVLKGQQSILEFNSIIRSFNSPSDEFYKALAVAELILTAQIQTILKEIADVTRWNGLHKSGRIAYQQDTDIILCWKEKAKEQGIFLLICPNLRGGWSIISRDTNELVIPKDPSQKFLHNSGFMATYLTHEEAQLHALKIISNLPEDMIMPATQTQLVND